MPRQCFGLACLLSLLLVPGAAQLRVGPPGERPDAIAFELMLRKLSNAGTFMQTDAHPDDEDNGLLAMLGHGQGMRTVLVTLTRGDGGQNEIGPELGQSLGVLRTEELLAVHRFDGAEQYFTRAIDFGYSFSAEESIEKWGHDEILGDLVRHIRAVRPDVIAGFLCGGQAGGQHHQAAATLSLEAFRAAADPRRYPEQLREGLRPWLAFRHFCTDENSFAPRPPPRTPDVIVADLSAFDPLLGRTYADLGLEARSMHRCQGTSQLLLLPGQTQNRRYRIQDQAWAVTGVGGLPGPGYLAAPGTMFEGVDTSIEGLMRFLGNRPSPRLAESLRQIQQSITASRQEASVRGPVAAVGPLASGLQSVRRLRGALPDLLPFEAVVGGMESQPPLHVARYEIDFRLAQKERQFQTAMAIAAGVRLDALANDGVVTAGQSVDISIHAAGAATLQAVTLNGFDAQPAACAGDLAKTVTCKATARIPDGTPLSTPYWRPRTDAARYDFEPDVPFGVPFRPTPFRATFELTIGGERVTVERPVEFRYSDITAGEKRSELNVSPPFNVTVDPEILIFPLQTPVASGFGRKTLQVTVANNQQGPANAAATLQLPAGWTSDPVSQPLRFSREDESATVTFSVQPPANAAAGDATVRAVVTTGTGARSDSGYQIIEYPHIHRRHVVQPAVARVKAMDVTIAPGLKVGYVMGVGDRVPEAMEQLGAEVTRIDGGALAFGDLSRFDAIVLGVRAYERRPDLRANNQRLLKYAGDGGTVIVQYQKTEFNEAQYGPFPATTSTDRITDENAPIEILAPNHPIFTTPNRLGPEAWRGWLQERGTYFLGQRDPRYVDLLRSQDPFPYNANAKTGILVEARVGKGRWLYTGLGLWRQLPAGTDGAYRLLANLISLGKQ